MNCRHCKSDLTLSLLDLGSAPPSNAYLTEQQRHAPERWYPLRVLVCENCWLVQTEDFADAQYLFDANYAYFSSYSLTWLEHCRLYVDQVVEQFDLGQESHVVEVAANDGYLLQYFAASNIPCTGIEPTSSTAAAARAKGLSIIEEFFGLSLALRLMQEGRQADLIVANNVLAHVPDINDFVSGLAALLKPGGVVTLEFPHLAQLIAEKQFDTIYHEHFSYLSLTVVTRILDANGLNVFDVERHPTHGGSLRVFAQPALTGTRPVALKVSQIVKEEEAAGVMRAEYYRGFQDVVNGVKYSFLKFLLEAKSQGKLVAAYGAAAKGNTLINYAGVGPDLIAFVADLNPAKQGNYLPGSRIPIVSETYLKEHRPDYVLILPWNLRAEICSQLSYIREWQGRFVTAIPEIEVF